MTTRDFLELESARVTRMIRQDIFDGLRPTGSKLGERELAAEFGVSRLPVRDALKTLVAEGLVTLRPRTWAVVREFTPSDIVDLSEVRAALESLAFSLAAQRHNRQGLQQLRANLDIELEAARTGDVVQARRAAADFHELVTALAGNELLNELQHVLRGRLRWLLVQHDDLLGVAEQHVQLCAAIADRNVPKVNELVLQHMENGRYLSGAMKADLTGTAAPPS